MKNEKNGVYVYMTTGLRELTHGLMERVKRRELSPVKYDQMVRQIIDSLRQYKKMINAIPAGRTRAMAVNKAIDEMVEYDRKQSEGQSNNRWKQLSCKRGCAHCCFQKVEITTDEAALLAKAIDSGIATIDESLLAAQRALPNDQDAYWLSDLAVRRCVFLDEKNECSVYELRPAACRKYFAFTSPENCANSTPGTKVGVIVVPEAEVLASAASDNDRDSMGVGMAEMLAKALEGIRKGRQ